MNKSILLYLLLAGLFTCFFLHTYENNNPKKKESTANGWTACNTYINMASASTRWT